MKKIIGILVCVLLVSTTLSVTSALSITNDDDALLTTKEDFGRKAYTFCYIESKGQYDPDKHFQIIDIPIGLPWMEKRFVLLWHMGYISASETTIYTRENGQILWESTGAQHDLVLVGYHGIRIQGNEHVISGRAMLIKPIIR